MDKIILITAIFISFMLGMIIPVAQTALLNLLN